jgi:hypothetical protein
MTTSDQLAVHRTDNELHLSLEVINPTVEQKQTVEDAHARFGRQVPETVQRQAGLWALDYFETTHRVILWLCDDESAVNRVVADVEQAARRFFPNDTLMRLWFCRCASVDIISHGKMALECLRRGEGLNGLDTWLGFYREMLTSDSACFDRLVGPIRLDQLPGFPVLSNPSSETLSRRGIDPTGADTEHQRKRKPHRRVDS